MFCLCDLMMILDKIKQVFFLSFSTVVISSAYDVLHLFMEQSHPLSHRAIIRVVLEDKVINSNTAKNSSSFIGQHPDYLGVDIHTEKTSHYTQTWSHDPFILAVSQAFCNARTGLYRPA